MPKKIVEEEDEYLGEGEEGGEDTDYIDVIEELLPDEEPSPLIRFVGPTRTDSTQLTSATAQVHKDEIDPSPITETTSKWNPGFVVRKKVASKKS